MRIIIIGAGEVGYHIASRLASEDKDVVVIDSNEKVLSRVSEQLDVQTVHGSGSSPKILERAGVRDAEILLAVTDSDEINLIACTFANILSPGLRKLARIRNPEYTDYQEVLAKDILDIDMVINPEEEVIRTIERLMGAPGAVEISDFSEGRIKLVGLWVREDSPVAGTKLFDLREKVGHERLIVAAIIRDDRLIIPQGDNALKDGDLIYFVCEDQYLNKVLHGFGIHSETLRNVLIIGGGNIGYKLAKGLEKRNVHVKIIELDRKRCEFLAENLNRTVVLQGDGTDQELLLEENVRSMDVVVTVTGDEEYNVLCSLLAKNLGSKMTITRINKFAYLPLVRTVGLENTVSPRLSAVNAILKHVREGRVISAISIKEEAEALEAIAQAKSELVGKPIKDLPFPQGAIVLCLIRGEEVIIPTGDSIIEPNDRVIVLSTRRNISRVEKALTVKLEYL